MKEKFKFTRREFLNLSLAGGTIMASNIKFRKNLFAGKKDKRPNIVLIMTDQQGLDTLSALGCSDVNTPNMDRLKKSGVTFMESYSTNPICSPARSSIYTGRMSSETGVIKNGLAIRSDIPNLGEVLSENGYETVYVGKWHLPNGYQDKIPGFKVLPAGIGVRGTLGDSGVSGVSEAFLRNYKGNKPFFLSVSFLQPHDICNWIKRNADEIENLPFKDIDKLPPLPPNFKFNFKESAESHIPRAQTNKWNELNWRYYLWSYYRMVEEVDKEIGRVLDAIYDSEYADNTMIIFTSDHGEGMARHRTVTKNFLYEESVKVPLIISFPGRIPKNRINKKNLVSGLDLFSTICDYAGIKPADNVKGLSLKPILERKNVNWREFLVTEVMHDMGRMIRTDKFKLIAYRNDPVIQLFDLQNDPWEKNNLAEKKNYKSEIKELSSMLEKWEQKLDFAENAKGVFKVKI